MAIIVVGVSVIILLTYLSVDYVLTRYHHTRKSLMVLGVEAAVCLLLGLFLGFGLAELAWYYNLAFTLLIVLPAFSVLSLVTVETWHRLKQGETDSEIGAMRQRMQDLQDQSDRLTWQIDNLQRRKKNLEREHDEDLFRQRKLENEIHRWQSGSGMERIRSLRVEAWSEELSDLSDGELAQQRQQLQDQVSSDDIEADREESLRVRLALIDLEHLQRRMAEPNKKIKTIKGELEDCQRRKADVDSEIRNLDRQIRAWIQDRGTSTDRKIELR